MSLRASVRRLKTEKGYMSRSGPNHYDVTDIFVGSFIHICCDYLKCILFIDESFYLYCTV